MATHSSNLAWRIPWTLEPAGYSPWSCKESGMIEPITLHIWATREAILTLSRRRRWHPLQYSCLENLMDGAAWWAAVHGVAKSRTWLPALETKKKKRAFRKRQTLAEGLKIVLHIWLISLSWGDTVYFKRNQVKSKPSTGMPFYSIYLFGCGRSLLWHMGLLGVACGI